jgi:DNA-binding winged helix-turn-helix (wHTH) protein/TolB-like protein/Flp pilus assembly protein TadD
MNQSAKPLYEFGPFQLDPANRALRRGEELVPLSNKAYDTLLALVERRDRVVEKDELMHLLWPDTVVEEGNLTQNIHLVRNALGSGPNGHPYIVTLPRRGYRFVAEVKEGADEEDGLLLAPPAVMEARPEPTVRETERSSQGESEPLPTAPSLPLHSSSLASPLVPFSRRGRTSQAALAILLLLLAQLGIVAYGWLANRGTEAAADAPVKSLAVLPFKPLDAESGDEYLGLGMADALITRLGNLRPVVVRPTSAVRGYSAQPLDPVAAGKALRVESVLEGSIQRFGERIRVTVQLISVRDGSPLWAEKFDEKFTDLFTVQDAISEKLADALALTLTGEERARLKKHGTEKAEAYQLYLKGRYHWNKWTEEGFKKGIEHFEQAIAQDPNYASAYAGVADSYLILGFNNHASPHEVMPRAKAAALKALALDDTLAEAHTSLAGAKLYYDWDFAGAEQGFKRAVQLNPRYPTAHQGYGAYLLAMGRFEEALAEMKRAEQLDGLSPIISAGVGWVHCLARQYDLAIAQQRRTLELDPHFTLARSALAGAYKRTARYQEALAEMRKALALSGRTPSILGDLGHLYAVSGQPGEARKILAELQELSRHTYVAPLNLAGIYIGLNDRERALAWLEKAYEERSCGMLLLKVSPTFDSLRADPRFNDLIERVGLNRTSRAAE